MFVVNVWIFLMIMIYQQQPSLKEISMWNSWWQNDCGKMPPKNVCGVIALLGDAVLFAWWLGYSEFPLACHYHQACSSDQDVDTPGHIELPGEPWPVKSQDTCHFLLRIDPQGNSGKQVGTATRELLQAGVSEYVLPVGYFPMPGQCSDVGESQSTFKQDPPAFLDL